EGKTFYEVEPGVGAFRHLATYAGLTWLAKRTLKRPQRFFTEVSANVDRHILAEGYFEGGVLKLLESLCRETGHTDLMIDVGANIGNHSVGLAHVFKRIEAIEPHPVLFHVLMANMLRNNVAHMQCHNFGLAGENATGSLVESSENHGLSKIKERSQLPASVFGLTDASFAAEFSVELRSAHDFVAQFTPSLSKAFIKIDVEGMEQEIIEAILPLIRAHRPLVGFEWFTQSQPKLTDIALGLEGYALYGIRMTDVGRNFAKRAMRLMTHGRYYTLERLERGTLDEVYPLALLVPQDRA
ncbi:MAG: FkbM family methyltransferase, partial [Beijerinckiaceae bacterium]